MAIEKLYCRKCQKIKAISNFYEATSTLDSNGKMSICKDCCNDLYQETFSHYNDINRTLYDVCGQLDIMYSNDAVESTKSHMQTLLSKGRDASAVFGYYKSKLGSVTKKNSSIKTSNFKNSDELNEGNLKTESANSTISTSGSKISKEKMSEFIAKWGSGYPKEVYLLFEKKYEFLKNNYPEKTSMHTEALLRYIRYAVMEEVSIAEQDSKEAKSWSDLASKAATSAKINPSQLSKSDLTGGLSSFGELIRAIEQSEDIIPILPEFKAIPRDRVDFTIWCYVNYIRDLKGLPLCEYNEVYEFYEIRKKEYEKHSLTDIFKDYDENDELDYDEYEEESEVGDE